MGPQAEDYIQTVLTCEGDFYDPEFHEHLRDFSDKLESLLAEGLFIIFSLFLVKVLTIEH